MRQSKMKTSYVKVIPMGKSFNKEQFIKAKVKVLSDMSITLTEMEMNALYKCATARQIETLIRLIINNRWN